MEDSSISAPPDFVALIEALAVYTGLSDMSVTGALGLVFEADPHTVRVFPHPGRAHWMLTEVEVAELFEWEQLPHEFLNQLNHAARLEHSWVASVGEDRRLVLHGAHPIAATSAAELEALMVEGIQRAEALATLWRSFMKTEGDENAVLATAAIEEASEVPAHFLRA
jgi:hypothetical protein